MALFNYFNCYAKVLLIGKIETEIENGEDITRPNSIKISLQLQPPMHLFLRAASNNAPVQTRVWPPKSESLE